MTEANTVPAHPAEPEPDQPTSPSLAQSLKDGAAVTLAVFVAGALLALLWAWLAPRVQYVSNGEAVFLADTENEGRIGADGTFFLLSLGFGLLSGLLAFLLLKRGGVAVVVGLAVGSVLAALLGWRLGIQLGPSRDLVAAAKAAGKGVPFDAPLQLLAHGVLLVWPMTAVAVHLGCVAMWGPRDPAPELTWPGEYPPPHVHAPRDTPRDTTASS
ncbi:hypothetical protein ACIQUQ_07710 [Streptomyces sp. NPDC101118]|uniref:hypothetical protein n=1 Tax=Streptomyces sp. NPDC101118 TaxID=3366109 RepID=UPI0037FB6EAB